MIVTLNSRARFRAQSKQPRLFGRAGAVFASSLTVALFRNFAVRDFFCEGPARRARPRLAKKATPGGSRRIEKVVSARGRVEFANQIANRLCDTGRYWASQTRMIRGKTANRSGWLNTMRHAPPYEFLELENRCTGNRTVGSNPTLSANHMFADVRGCPRR